MATIRSYHGVTQGTIFITSGPRKRPNEVSKAGVFKFFDPYRCWSNLYKLGMTDEQFAEKILRKQEETLIFLNLESVEAIFF